MRVLHISHHVGCMRDHAYIYDKLGVEYEFWKFPKDLFRITKDVADQIWNERNEYFNQFDFIVTSDTAPLSRIFMEHLDQLKAKVVVWICNRFDYNMEGDASFYEIFNRMSIEHQDKVKIIPYSDFEGIWCKKSGISFHLPTITPIGIEKRELDYKIDGLIELKTGYIEDPNAKMHYNYPVELNNKLFIPIYGNDNYFYNIKQIFIENDIPFFNGGYKHPEDLKHCIGLVTFPDAFSKLITFETIQNEIVVFLPSPEFLIQLHPTVNNNTHYWFNSPVGHLNQDLVQLCEWYRFKECRIYFDSIPDMIHKIKTLTPEIIAEKRKWCRIYGEKIEKENMQKWSGIFNSNGFS
jgi:hypothetical protein